MGISKVKTARGSLECRGRWQGVSEVTVAHGGELKAVLGASMGLVIGGEGEATLGE